MSKLNLRQAREKAGADKRAGYRVSGGVYG